jgi:hypothetical protein
MRECERTVARLGTVPVDFIWDEAKPLFDRALRGFCDDTDLIRLRCQQGLSQMLASDDAFIVCERQEESDEPVMVIWAAVARNHKVDMDDYLDQLESICQTLGCVRMLFWTNRRGFERKLPKGWYVKSQCWAKEILTCQ